jgi:L-threonylcarbamoyladenylate synthase
MIWVVSRASSRASVRDLTVERAIEAIEAGKIVLMPTDTVYGLVTTAGDEAAVSRMYAAKGRSANQPTALVAADVDALLVCLPELSGAAEATLRGLLPGPYTLVVPNPARRYPWLCGPAPGAIGVRVPALAGRGKEVLDEVGAIAATSANLPGGRDPRRVADLAPTLVAAAACVVDGGELPGVPSTVIDLTGAEPSVLRVGAGDVASALARLTP